VLPIEDNITLWYDRQRSSPGSGWTTNDDVLEFTATDTTSALGVYIDTVANGNGAGYVYLDDFSIAVLEYQGSDRVRPGIQS